MKPSALLCVALGLASNAALAQLPECRVGFPSGAERDLPLAATPESRTLGLSGRDEVGDGMLFAWPQEGLRELWMKDTRVALSACLLYTSPSPRD